MLTGTAGPIRQVKVGLVVVGGHLHGTHRGLPRSYSSTSAYDPMEPTAHMKPCLALEAKVKVIHTVGTSEGTEPRREPAGQKS